MINVEEMMELENHHLATTILIIASGKNHQRKLKFVGEFAKEHDTYIVSRLSSDGASLVAQWLRVCLLMQGTRV